MINLKHTHLPRLATTLALLLTLTACSSNLRTGALGGAAAGAVIGGIASGSARGAIIGAAIGGAAGAAIGGIMDAQAEDLQDKLTNAQVERVGEGIHITFDSGIRRTRYLRSFSDCPKRCRTNTSVFTVALNMLMNICPMWVLTNGSRHSGHRASS